MIIHSKSGPYNILALRQRLNFGRSHSKISRASTALNPFKNLVLKSSSKSHHHQNVVVGSPIPPTCSLWRQHAHDDALSWPDRYVRRMAEYNELCRTTGFEVIGDNQNLYINENLYPEEKVVAGKKPEDGVKLEKEDNFNLDDIDIDLEAV
ncbi:hypothetical protein MTR_1g044315 [Medicago truncatula]|uniref:Uncharacterized protein n=1 Tax=Medicago truncatula TaxID=3880 RepID=A0A072VH52_MEDTR|nr:hypothetical protein MTR_1g044315 [Medicago truncatula]